jgi:hypothetical protein
VRPPSGHPRDGRGRQRGAEPRVCWPGWPPLGHVIPKNSWRYGISATDKRLSYQGYLRRFDDVCLAPKNCRVVQCRELTRSAKSSRMPVEIEDDTITARYFAVPRPHEPPETPPKVADLFQIKFKPNKLVR